MVHPYHIKALVLHIKEMRMAHGKKLGVSNSLDFSRNVVNFQSVTHHEEEEGHFSTNSEWPLLAAVKNIMIEAGYLKRLPVN
ncbi:hypothetical protein PIB30_079925 [Stylosanthes scabra]|uniref:Uncharacterized protein n=1 Tax=Stylosanthes scabra TaxID=79078 RepID=A0ABU6TQU0_9FABA|nr:hypothetical protein [Stylosanthes scabra]